MKPCNSRTATPSGRAAARLCATGVPPVLRRQVARQFPLATRQWHATERRRGVTLMELVLVLVLLVVIGSLAIPPIISAFSSVKLRRAGDAVISRWAQARAQAIETGTPYQFRFTPETGNYRVEPWSGVTANEPANDAKGDTATTAKVETPATQKSLDEKATIASNLPDTIMFQGGQSVRLEPTSGERQVGSLKTPESSLSTPILFFPDGTCTQATIVLQSDVPNFLRLTLRGLTGVARASGVLTREEMERGSQTP